MPYHFELITDRPVLLNTLGPPFNGDLMADMAAETIVWLERLDHRVYYLINTGQIALGLSDVMQGAYAAARGPNPPLHHPKVIETILITNDPMLKMAMKSLDSVVFGFLNVRPSSSLDEALAYVDAQMASRIDEPTRRSSLPAGL
jgi:hypothetical protein